MARPHLAGLLAALFLATVASATTYSATITWYGTNDERGSPNCNSNTVACGFYTYPGYSAAVSQNLYGVGPGKGSGPACGTCLRVVGMTDESGKALSNAGVSIIVMVNNLCPAEGNPLCAQSGLNGTNQLGSQIDVNLCNDSGANAAFFGKDGVGLALGNATEVDCSEWQGTKKYDKGSGDSSSNGNSSSNPDGIIAKNEGSMRGEAMSGWVMALIACAFALL